MKKKYKNDEMRSGKLKIETCPRRNEQKASSNFRSMPSEAIKHSHITFALLIYKRIVEMHDPVITHGKIIQNSLNPGATKILNKKLTNSICLLKNPRAI